jgi:hypothetical protein
VVTLSGSYGLTAVQSAKEKEAGSKAKVATFGLDKNVRPGQGRRRRRRGVRRERNTVSR